jgi:hypothetical protein
VCVSTSITSLPPPTAQHEIPQRWRRPDLLVANGEPKRKIALHFADDTPPAIVYPWRSALGSSTLLLTALLVALRRRISWTLGLPAVLALAIAPLGAGLCWDLAAALGPADLQQCADGRGGASLQMLPHADGLGLYVAVLLFTVLDGISTAALSRRLALALAVLAMALAARSLDPQVLVDAQASARWGLWMQPFAAAALLLTALAELAAARAHGPLATRLSALGLAVLVTTLCLGGADLPGTQPFTAGLPHAAGLGLGLIVWLIKVTVVAWLLRRVQLPRRAAFIVLPAAPRTVCVEPDPRVSPPRHHGSTPPAPREPAASHPRARIASRSPRVAPGRSFFLDGVLAWPGLSLGP